MNAAQFKIVKSMQAIGIEASKFAKATGTPATTMLQAYAAGSYERFKSAGDDPMGQFNSIFGTNL